MNSARASVAVLGAGAWGTALTIALATSGRRVILWGRNAAKVDRISRTRRNEDYLHEVLLPEAISVTADLETAIRSAEIVLVVIPAQQVGAFGNTLRTQLTDGQTLVLCAKGIDRKTGKLPVELLREKLPNHSIAALSGPSFAQDVARGLPTAITLAHNDLLTARALSKTLSSNTLRIYASDDVKGVELGGALKNVIALAVGITRGMGLGSSAEAALATRGFAELMRLAGALGARRETLMGLSGMGDLILTCSGEQSRNFRYGMALGKGEALNNLPLAEGAFTASVAVRLAHDHAIDAPIIQAVAKLVDGAITPAEAMAGLLSRPLKPESEG